MDYRSHKTCVFYYVEGKIVEETPRGQSLVCSLIKRISRLPRSGGWYIYVAAIGEQVDMSVSR
jgi:hypothetical protein